MPADRSGSGRAQKVNSMTLLRTGPVLALPLLLAAAHEAPPPTRRAPVEDRYHGTVVVDDYRWLEDAQSPEVRAWIEAQNRYTRTRLDALPGVERLRRRVRGIRTIEVPRYDGLKSVGGRLFALRFLPPQQQPVLVTLASADQPDTAHVLVDLNQLDPAGGTSMDWYVPAHDGRRVAVSLARGGSERGDVHVYDVDTGRPLADVVRRVNYGTAGGSLAWDARGEGFYYTRYPREGERAAADLDFYVQVYYHRLGTPESADRYEIGKDFPRIAEIELRARGDGRYLLATYRMVTGVNSSSTCGGRTARGRVSRASRTGCWRRCSIPTTRACCCCHGRVRRKAACSGRCSARAGRSRRRIRCLRRERRSSRAPSCGTRRRRSCRRGTASTS